MDTSKLTTLLPTMPYTLAYTLPLLLISTPLIFAGTFLTLDRTRSFAPRKNEGYKAIDGLFQVKPKKRTFSWYLEGGIGGLLIGYTFGVHASTLLALAIPAKTAAASLSSKSFLAVWILPCLPTTILAGRYRLAASLFAGLEGGILIALGLSIILHPSLLPRLILLGVFSVLLTTLLVVSLFIPRLSATLLHPVFRICTAASGAYGMVLSIALLSSPPVDSWANSWERLWVRNGEGWGTGKEQGLSAAWGIFWVAGIASDWALRRYFGECPDEKWDDYLLKYVSDLPNHSDRAGTFQPLTSFWDRLFKAPQKDYDLYNVNFASRSKKDDIVFPSDADMKTPNRAIAGQGPFLVDPFTQSPPLYQSPTGKLQRISSTSKTPLEDDSEVMNIPSSTAFLKKSRSQKSESISKARLTTPSKSRKPVKFGAIDELSSSEDDSDRERPPAKTIKTVKTSRPWVITNHPPSYSSNASSTPTLVSAGEMGRKASEHVVIEHSDPFVDAAPSAKGSRGVEIDYDKELERLKKARGEKFDADTSGDYSDKEDVRVAAVEEGGLAMQRPSTPSSKPQSQWSPGFLRRHQESVVGVVGSGVRDSSSPPTAGAIPIPATPSLIQAVDRIQKAQREVYSPLGVAPRDGLPSRKDDLHLEQGLREDEDAEVSAPGRQQQKSPRWEDFWREVKVKANAPS